MVRVKGTAETGSLLAVWKKVFRSADPFGWPFQPAIVAGRVLYPIDGCLLAEDQFESLRRAMAAVGESEFYLAVTESGSADAGLGAWSSGTVDYKSYCSLQLTLENAVFSKNGRWGILISHEMHAVVGGDAGFIAELNAQVGDGVSEWRAFSGQWTRPSDQPWLAELRARLGP